MSTFEERCEYLEDELADIRAKRDAALDACEARIAELEADIAAYETRIAELEALYCPDYGDKCVYFNRHQDAVEKSSALAAELARVKSESLRVVPEENPDPFIIYDWYMTPTGLGYGYQDYYDEAHVSTPDDDYSPKKCTPVRLERWENE